MERYRPDIDGLRALAVLGVVFYHVAPSALPGGFLGVDVFFAISGYLITRIVIRERADGVFHFASFYARRVRRLFPALITVLVSCLVFGFVSLFANELEQLARHAAYAIGFILNFQVMREAGYFDVAAYTKPLLHLWSLAVEEQFYLVWPALLVLMARLRLNLMLATVLLAAMSFAVAIHIAQTKLSLLYFHPAARFWELLLGAMVAFWVDGRAERITSNTGAAAHLLACLAPLVGLGIIVVSFFLASERNPHPGWRTLVPLVGALLILGSRRATFAGRFLAWRPLVLIGLISYPLYLWHWPVLSFIRILESGAPSSVLLLCGVLVSFALAAATYLLIERPLRQTKGRGRADIVGLGLAMSLLFTAAYLVVIWQGLPNRSVVEYVKLAGLQMVREARQDPRCLALFAGGEAPVYCRQTTSRSRMIAVVGDSHAHVLFPGVSKIAAEGGYGTLLLANSGCPPFIGAATGRNVRERSDCAASIGNITNKILSDARIEAVVIASRGPQYIDGKGFGPAEAGYNYPPIAPAPPDDSDTPPEEVFIRGLAATIESFHQRGLRVAYLLQVPELGVPSRNCLLRPMTLTPRAGGCEVPYDIYRARMQSYWRLIEGLRQKLNYLVVIDPGSLFCNSESCGGFRNRQLLYADDNHLSVIGSSVVAPTILKALGVPPSATSGGQL